MSNVFRNGISELTNNSVHSKVEGRVRFGRGELRCDSRDVDRDSFAGSESYVFRNTMLQHMLVKLVVKVMAGKIMDSRLKHGEEGCDMLL